MLQYICGLCNEVVSPTSHACRGAGGALVSLIDDWRPGNVVVFPPEEVTTRDEADEPTMVLYP